MSRLVAAATVVLLSPAVACKLSLDDKEHVLHTGDTVIMPAGTIISDTNTRSDEAVLVIVWANIEKKGPLFVHGRPEHQKKDTP
jgi:hypothetical protein